MRELINKTQQKIYAIWRKAKQHISSFVGGQLKKQQTLTNNKKQMKLTVLRKLNATLDERNCIYKFLGDFTNWFKTNEDAKKYLKWLNTCDRTLDFEIPNGRTFRLNIEYITQKTPLTFKCKYSEHKEMKNYAGANEYMWVDIGEDDNMELIFIDKDNYVLKINGIVGEETAFDHLIDRVIEIAPNML